MHFKLIVVTIRADLSDAIVSAARKAGATGATIIPARGVGIHGTKTIFGLTMDIQRDVIMLLLEEHLVKSILKIIKKVGSFHQPGAGIAFVLDVDKAIGMESQIPNFIDEV
ncbi:MAG: P-II family nitrogen regulator [Magnetococcales bacterium]|nr:P-II family nitrogen regulator [Magnetococcales bacterium]MBF0438081.1 P-II family nitrogen regulator [Magnetococcales bacterium]